MYLKDNTLLQGGKYRIIRFIQHGGFGCTYEAEHVMLGKRVAIKEFFVKDFCNRDPKTSHVTVGTVSKMKLVEKLKSKFLDEAKGLASLSHPGIVAVTDVFEESTTGTAYFVMDFIDGPSLSQIVKKEGKLPEARALKYIREVCDALEHVHSKKRLHLDIKPGNIMIRKDDDHAVLIDFGASKQYTEEEGENTSTIVGTTPGYAPIEQMGHNLTSFSSATDIYALAATLYKILSGKTPPQASALASGDPLPPLPAEISQTTVEAITKGMKQAKKDRPQSIAEFRALLDGKNQKPEPPEQEPKHSEDEDEATQVVGVQYEDKPETREPHNAPEEENADPGWQPEQEQNPVPEPDSKPTKPKKQRRKPETEPRVLVYGDELENQQNQNSEAEGNRQNGGGKKVLIIALVAILIAGAVVGGYMFYKKGAHTTAVNDGDDPESSEVPITPTKVEDLTFTNSNGITFTYTGEVDENQVPNGNGKGIYKEGVYEGEYKDGLRHGHAKYKTGDGINEFEGEYADDHYKEGKLVFLKDNMYYQGTFKNDQLDNGVIYNTGTGKVEYKIVNGQYQ